MFFDITRVCKKRKSYQAMYVHVKNTDKTLFLTSKENTAWHSVN